MDICDELEAKWGTVHSGAFNAMRKAKREIERLREWIAEEGNRTDTCTRNVLGKVCENCRCGKSVDA